MTSTQISLRELRERNETTNYPTLEPGELLALVEAVEAAHEWEEAEAEASELCSVGAYEDDSRCVAAAEALRDALARFKDYA